MIKRNSKHYYEDQSEKIAASAWNRLKMEPPCDLQAICDFLHINVVRQELVPDLLGLYMRTEDGIAEIRVNSHITPTERQRFIWAHEIGHHILAHSVKGKLIIKFRTNKNHTHFLERECNHFASCLLMPATQVFQIAKELHHPDQDKSINIASRFDVSVQAMRKRLYELGIPGHFTKYV